MNLFNAAFSPVDGNAAWVMALDIDQANAGDPSGGRHFYLSEDGGRSFTPVVDESPDVTLTNGPEITPHPRRPLRIARMFGSSFSGLDIYQYDAGSGELKKNHYPGLLARTASMRASTRATCLSVSKAASPWARRARNGGGLTSHGVGG